MAAILDLHGCCLKSSSFQPVREMEFSYREIKFQVRVDCLDVKTKTSKALGKTLLDLRCYISLQDGGHIRLTWLLFDIILLSSRERDGILISRDEVLRDSTLS